MKTQFVEATNGPNWGKFCVAVFEPHELAVRSAIAPGESLIRGRGWSHGHVLVLDLQTGEGATFRMGGLASADLNKHRIWVCVLFERFLEWLYVQPDPMNLPAKVDLPDVPFAWTGYRRSGPDSDIGEAVDLINQLVAALAEHGASHLIPEERVSAIRQRLADRSLR